MDELYKKIALGQCISEYGAERCIKCVDRCEADKHKKDIQNIMKIANTDPWKKENVEKLALELSNHPLQFVSWRFRDKDNPNDKFGYISIVCPQLPNGTIKWVEDMGMIYEGLDEEKNIYVFKFRNQ